jgi:hypothetical protein
MPAPRQDRVDSESVGEGSPTVQQQIATPAVETASYAQMVRRIIRAYAKRVGDGDVEDLAVMIDVDHYLHAMIGSAIAAMRANGLSWADVARATGTTRQAAQQRWR